MSKITKMLNIADIHCLSRKIMKSYRFEPIPLAKLDANKVRPLNAHLDQWDFYNRERLIQQQRQAEQAEMRYNLKTHAKFTMNPLPDYSQQVKKNKNDKEASKRDEDSKENDAADGTKDAKKSDTKKRENKRKRVSSKRQRDDSKLGSDANRSGSDASKRVSYSSRRDSESTKRGSGESKRASYSSKRDSDSSKLGSDKIKSDGDPSKSGVDPSKSDGDPSKSDGDASKSGGDPNKSNGDPSKSGGDPSKSDGDPSKSDGDPNKPSARDSSKRGRDSSKHESDKNKRESSPRKSSRYSNKQAHHLRKPSTDSKKQSCDSSDPFRDFNKQVSDSKRSGSGSRSRRSSSKRHRSNSSRRRTDGSVSQKKGIKDRFSSPWKNPLGKTLEYLTTEEYKRISPEFLKLLQELELKKRKRTSSPKHRARWKNDVFNNLPTGDKDPLETLSPALAQYLRAQMEAGNIMNKIYNIDFYTKDENEDLNSSSLRKNPYNAMNLHELKNVLKTLKAGGTLTRDELKFLYTFLESAAEMNSEDFESVMRISKNLGIFTPKMVDYLKELMMKANASSKLTPENLNDVLTTMGASVDFPKFIITKRVFPQKNAIRDQDEEVQDAEENTKKKGYIYPNIDKILTEEYEVEDDERQEIQKLGPRPDRKNDYFNFRIDRPKGFRRGHPAGYYEPIAVDEFVLAGLTEFQRLSVPPRTSTLSKLALMQEQQQNPQPVSPQPSENKSIMKSKPKSSSKSKKKKVIRPKKQYQFATS